MSPKGSMGQDVFPDAPALPFGSGRRLFGPKRRSGNVCSRAAVGGPERSRCFYDGVDAPPTASMCQSGGVEHHLREASVSEVITIGLDIAKHVFHVHGADERGRAMFNKRISRGKLLDFFAAHPSCKVALEACGGAHHWARQLTQLGHEVRLIPPAQGDPATRSRGRGIAQADDRSWHRSTAVLHLQMLGADSSRDPVSSSIGGQPHQPLAPAGPITASRSDLLVFMVPDSRYTVLH
jgi:hypothetical protein